MLNTKLAPRVAAPSPTSSPPINLKTQNFRSTEDCFNGDLLKELLLPHWNMSYYIVGVCAGMGTNGTSINPNHKGMFIMVLLGLVLAGAYCLLASLIIMSYWLILKGLAPLIVKIGLSLKNSIQDLLNYWGSKVGLTLFPAPLSTQLNLDVGGLAGASPVSLLSSTASITSADFDSTSLSTPVSLDSLDVINPQSSPQLLSWRPPKILAAYNSEALIFSESPGAVPPVSKRDSLGRPSLWQKMARKFTKRKGLHLT